MAVSEQERKQILKARVYGKTNEEIVEAMNISAEDIPAFSPEELEAEKAYYREMGWL